MNEMTHKYRKLIASLVVVGTLSAPVSDAFAQGRPIQTYPSAQPGCDASNVAPAMANAGAYTYAQEYSTSYALIHEPTTYFGCLQGILSQAQSLYNMFTGSGNLNIAGLLLRIAQQVIQSLISQLETAACSAVGELAGQGITSNLLNYMNQLPTSAQ